MTRHKATLDSTPVSTARRVAILEDTPAIGGAEINTLNLARTANPNALELFVFVPQAGALAEALATTRAHVCNLDIPRFRSISFYWRGRKVLNPFAVVVDLFILVLFILRVWRATQRFRIEILHTNGIFAHFAGGIAAKLAGCRCIWHLQDIVEPQHRLRRCLLSWWGGLVADNVVVISPPVLDQLTGSARGRAVLVPNGVDLSLFRARQATSADGPLRAFAGDRLLVLLVGRLARWKGQHVLLEVARQMTEERSDIAFALVGDAAVGEPDYAAELQRFVRQHQLAGAVMLAGWQQDIARVYQQGDIVALTSTEPEPFGLVVIEAMASGLPVIATNHGGPAYIIEHGVTGILVPPADVPSLVDAITHLAEAPDIRQRMAEQARSQVEQHFSIEAYVEQLQKIYEAVC